MTGRYTCETVALTLFNVSPLRNLKRASTRDGGGGGGVGEGRGREREVIACIQEQLENFILQGFSLGTVRRREREKLDLENFILQGIIV